MSNNSQRGLWIVAIVAVVLISLCLCVVLIGIGGLTIFGISRSSGQSTETIQNEPQPQLPTPVPFPTRDPQSDLAQPPDLNFEPVKPGAQETLRTLQTVQIPFADLRSQAMEFLNLPAIPETVAFPGEFDPGDERSFWVLNTDTNQYKQVDTILGFESQHLYFWIEKGLSYDKADLSAIGNEFEEKTYPTNREFFGSEWTPGVDGDEHLYIIFATDMGENLAGMFSSADSVNPIAYSYSNGHETFFLNADTVGLEEEFTYGVLAHEFQHMIHWYRDRNEETWLNEGFSELAAYLNGYDVGGFDMSFLLNPSTQLNNWPNGSDSNEANYGASFLFVNYFLERFGEEATQQLVGSPTNGLESIDQVLESLNITQLDSSQPYRADDLFADWMVANYLDDPSIEKGQYGYTDYDIPFGITDIDNMSDCLGGWQTSQANQFGASYIQLNCTGQRTLQFEGASEVNLLPEDPHSGDFAFWSNQGDESQTSLSRSFDLTGVDGPVELRYWTWYDIETDYDYLYLQVSEDGKKWSLLAPPACTDYNPTGANYGCAYNGQSGEWIEETVDLSGYAGKQVWLRFTYVTDAAVNGEGMLIDDLSIPAIGYQTDFETDDGGWQAEGFARIQNRLPQSFRLALIYEGNQNQVEVLDWIPGEILSVPIDFDQHDQVTLVISGTTRFTRQPGAYRIQINK